MIKLVREGTYQLTETKGQTKILKLDNNDEFAWVNIKSIGEILVTTHKAHKTDCILSIGTYRMYQVEKEPLLTDLTHLELSVGNGKWQGYLLLTGLPSDKKKRNRIVPTNEVITKTTST